MGVSRLANYSFEQLENDARDFRNTADSQIVEVNNATRRGIVQVGDIFRILKYDHATGTLFNSTAGDPERTPRNILLNNTTIQTILDKIVRSASDPAEGRKHLREAGFECGQHFGTLVNQMKGTGEPDLVPILREWFEYDSNAGFGKFDLVDDGPGSIKIVLRYNFLLTGNEYIRPEKNLCEYMTGYIHGVISALPGAALRRKGFEPKYVVVEHPKEHCICDQKMYDLGCTFFVKGIA